MILCLKTSLNKSVSGGRESKEELSTTALGYLRNNNIAKYRKFFLLSAHNNGICSIFAEKKLLKYTFMKRIALLFTTITIIVITITGCEDYKVHHCKCDNMPEQTMGDGLIVKNATLSSKLSLYGDTTNYTGKYQNMVVSFDNGVTYEPIDTNKYTMISHLTYSGATPRYIRSVYKDDADKKYIYHITVLICGYTEELEMNNNFVLIPKVEDGYTGEYMVEYKRWERGKITDYTDGSFKSESGMLNF